MLIALLVVGVLATVVWQNAIAAVPGSVAVNAGSQALDLDALFQKYAGATGIDWRLLKAIAMHESSLNVNAYNGSEPNGRASYGLMQVECPDSLMLDGWCGDKPCSGNCADLFAPDFNVKIASGILLWNLEQYGFPRGVAVYNDAGETSAPVDGPFDNQSYVDTVLSNLRALGADPASLQERWGAGARG